MLININTPVSLSIDKLTDLPKLKAFMEHNNIKLNKSELARQLGIDRRTVDTVVWEDILRFNWDCIIATADRALSQGIDVLIDYVIEDELPRVRELAASRGAKLYYIVLTAAEEELERRIRSRGDVDMIERAKFLKRKLDWLPENIGHIYDNTGKDHTVRAFFNEGAEYLWHQVLYILR